MPYPSLWWLALGALLNLFAFGRWSLPIAAWLAPVLLLHSCRLGKPARTLALLYLALWITIFWAYRGLIPAPGWAPAGITALIALAGLVPFVLDRLVAARVPGFASTLAFPLAWAVVDFAAGRASPYGTWGSLAYTQYGNLPLMQLASATGTVGITFLIAWFASVLNWGWAGHFDWAAIRTGMLVYGGALCLVLGLGAARLVFTAAPAASVRVAAVGWPEGLLPRSELWRALDPALSLEDRQHLVRTFESIQQYFFDVTRREARAGAQIIVWPEANVPVFHEDEAALLQRAGELAREERVHILLGMANIHSGSDRPLENKAVLIGPAGSAVLGYAKAIPVPGGESRLSRSGPRRIATIDSPFGGIATAICFDMDFPAYIRQVGAAGADLLLVPASDWQAINRVHYTFAVLRAIENGVPMVRATRWGNSVAVDALGNEVAKLDPFVAPNRVMVAQVPLGHVATIYARWGDWFGWSCVAGLVALSAWAMTLARQPP
jgi:apolipoprotein N-acyltransferase